jgi:hypothetical protein
MYKISEELGRLVFVGGSPRSGTTLVQRVLNHHPKVYGGPEFDFIPSIAELYQKFLRGLEKIQDCPGINFCIHAALH